MTASLSISAATPPFLIHEYDPSITPKGLIQHGPSTKAAAQRRRNGPGLGCEVDEALLEQLSKEPHKAEWPTRGRLPDGSISDY
jgi:hypothetical protein